MKALVYHMLFGAECFLQTFSEANGSEDEHNTKHICAKPNRENLLCGPVSERVVSFVDRLLHSDC